MAESSYAFDEDTALEPVAGEHLTFTAGMSHRWDTVGPPNGGLLLALATRGLARAVPFPDPITVTGHFFRPCRHEPVELRAETVRTGRTLATATGRLLQDGKEVLRTLATFADLGMPQGPTQAGPAGPPPLPPPEECPPVRSLRAQAWEDLPGRKPAIYDSIEIRLGASDRREAGELARLEGWMRFSDGREPDVASLPLLADAFPPAVLDIAESAWVPTVELTVHVRGRPAPGWIAASFRTKFLCDGYFEEDGELWDSTGRLVALSRQLALTRSARPSE